MYLRIPIGRRRFLEISRRGINIGFYDKKGSYTSAGTQGFAKTFRLPFGLHFYFHNGRPSFYWAPRRKK